MWLKTRPIVSMSLIISSKVCNMGLIKDMSLRFDLQHCFTTLENPVQKDGLKIMCFMSVILGTRELIQILFRSEDSLTIKTLFYFSMILIFALSSKSLDLAAISFTAISVFFFSISLYYRSKFEDLVALSQFQSKSILGFLYLGLMPAFSLQLINLPQGELWFLGLLLVVLSGDTSAYFCGRYWGKKKLMPDISPKKTIAGAIGGVIASTLVGVGLSFFLKNISSTPLVIFCGLTGIIAQMGDLFESAVKRRFGKKDSGALIPGHGGLLDRVDGLLVAAPALAAARSNFASQLVMPSSPALSLIHAACTPLLSISPVNSPSIQSATSASDAACAQSGIHGSR